MQKGRALVAFIICLLISVIIASSAWNVQAQYMPYSVSGSLAPNMRIFYGISAKQADTVSCTVSPQSGGVTVNVYSPSAKWITSSNSFVLSAQETGTYSLEITAPSGYSNFNYSVTSTNPILTQTQLMPYSVSGSLAPNMHMFYGITVNQGERVIYTVYPQSGGVTATFDSPSARWITSSNSYVFSAQEPGTYSLEITAPSGYSNFSYTISSTHSILMQTQLMPYKVVGSLAPNMHMFYGITVNQGDRLIYTVYPQSGGVTAILDSPSAGWITTNNNCVLLAQEPGNYSLEITAPSGYSNFSYSISSTNPILTQNQLMPYTVSGSLAPNMHMFYGITVDQGDRLIYTISPQSGGVSAIFDSPSAGWITTSTNCVRLVQEPGTYSLQITAPSGFTNFSYTISSTNPILTQTQLMPYTASWSLAANQQLIYGMSVSQNDRVIYTVYPQSGGASVNFNSPSARWLSSGNSYVFSAQEPGDYALQISAPSGYSVNYQISSTNPISGKGTITPSTPSPSPTPAPTPTATPTPQPAITPTPMPTASPAPTVMPTQSPTASPTPTISPTATPAPQTPTPEPTITPYPTTTIPPTSISPTYSPTVIPVNPVSPTAESTSRPTVTPLPSKTPGITLKPSSEPLITPTNQVVDQTKAATSSEKPLSLLEIVSLLLIPIIGIILATIFALRNERIQDFFKKIRERDEMEANKRAELIECYSNQIQETNNIYELKDLRLKIRKERAKRLKVQEVDSLIEEIGEKIKEKEEKEKIRTPFGNRY